MAKKEVKPTIDFPFGRENYVLMIAGLAIIFLGFILMSGGGSEDPAVWDLPFSVSDALPLLLSL